jgi:hypothetical protein
MSQPLGPDCDKLVKKKGTLAAIGALKFPKKSRNFFRRYWRRRADSNRCIEVLQALSAVDGQSTPARLAVKDPDGSLRGEAIPRVHIVKYAHYSSDGDDAEQEVDIFARLNKALAEQENPDPSIAKLHGMVPEGSAAYGHGSNLQTTALTIAILSGLPVVRVGRSDPRGRVGFDARPLHSGQ